MARTLWLMGGLGNVLFQLFAKRIIERDYGEVKICDRLLQRNWLTTFAHWTIHEPVYKRFVDIEFTNRPMLLPILGMLQRQMSFNTRLCVFLEDYKLPKHLSKDGDIFGYFQSSNILHREAYELASYCAELYPCIVRQSSKFRAVIHFRAGDSTWASANAKYYQLVRETALKAGDRCLVLTDTISEAQTFFSDSNIFAIQTNLNAFESFSIMASSAILYVAPSTFSWWAANINCQATKIYMPKPIYQNIGYYNSSELIQL